MKKSKRFTKKRERDFLGYPVHENWIERNAYLVFGVVPITGMFIYAMVRIFIVILNGCK